MAEEKRLFWDTKMELFSGQKIIPKIVPKMDHFKTLSPPWNTVNCKPENGPVWDRQTSDMSAQLAQNENFPFRNRPKAAFYRRIAQKRSKSTVRTNKPSDIFGCTSAEQFVPSGQLDYTLRKWCPAGRRPIQDDNSSFCIQVSPKFDDVRMSECLRSVSVCHAQIANETTFGVLHLV